MDIDPIFESKSLGDLPHNGTCYEDAYNYFMKNHDRDKNLRLVHTLVDGQGSLEGIRYNHAFVVTGDTVIDPSQPKNQKFPKIIYYSIGNIREKSKYYFEYNFEEVLDKVLKFETYGPWEKILINNKY